MPKEFKNLPLDRDKILPCIEELGVIGGKMTETDACLVVTGTWKEAKLRINVYAKGGGLTTLGYSSGFDRPAFEEVAEAIAEACSFKGGQRLEVSIKLKPENVTELSEFLKENKATLDNEEVGPLETRQRWKGKNGDTLTIKVYGNGTVQFQGRHLHLASLVWDYLTSVLSLDSALAKQLTTYKVPVTVADIKSELENRIPVAYGRLHAEIRKQLGSALAWSKVDIELEDYSNAAFPALRAVEGFLYQELQASGLKPVENGNFGEYFEVNGSLYTVKPVCAGHLNGIKGTLLAEMYGLYHKQRHGLAHMSVLLVGTRTLATMQEAINVINRVFESIENFYHKA